MVNYLTEGDHTMLKIFLALVGTVSWLKAAFCIWQIIAHVGLHVDMLISTKSTLMYFPWEEPMWMVWSGAIGSILFGAWAFWLMSKEMK
jgi:ABC-type cobalt transport system substrate-binding protein